MRDHFVKSEGDSPTSEPHPKLRWQAIGRFAAAVSVILSLVFVGWEIRQNNAVEG